MTGLRDTDNLARALDVLQTDGGWLTAQGIHLYLTDVRPQTLQRALWKLHHKGHIHHRIVDLTQRETRCEWKAA